MPQIIKSDGGVEAFDPEKLVRSLMHAGAEESVARSVGEEISREVREGMSTHDIYARAFARLKADRHAAAARYSLKRAVLEFGPSGFPFESYVAELFRAEGYEAIVDAHIRGLCVEHEVDLVLSREGEKIYGEAKFHNTIGFKTDLQVALYVQARLEDIFEAEEKSQAHKAEKSATKHSGLIVTNTKFTSLAIAYGSCRGLALLGWEYPARDNLHERINRTRLYPVTALISLSRRQKQSLLAERIVLVSALSRHEDALARAGVDRNQMRQVFEEAAALSAPASALAPATPRRRRAPTKKPSPSA